MEFLGVFHADPDPGAAASLVAAAQVHDGALARYAGEIMAAPVGIAKAKFIHVKAETGLHAFHAQDGLAVFEMDSDWAALWHRSPPFEILLRKATSVRAGCGRYLSR